MQLFEVTDCSDEMESARMGMEEIRQFGVNVQ